MEREATNGDEGASLDLVTLYSEIGDAQSDEKWRDLAAIFVWNHIRAGRENLYPESDPDGAIARAAYDLAARLESNEVAAIEARLTNLAARPPVVKEAESSFWRAFMRRLYDRGAYYYFYWSVFLQLRSTFHKPDIAVQRWSLESAAYSFSSYDLLC